MAKAKIIETATVTLQAPGETGGDEVAVKRKVANHQLLSATGDVVEDEKEANGIRYTLVALPDRPFTYRYGANATVDKFLSIFGAKTLATNETSAARNGPKGESSPAEQIEAVEARFALLATGEWVDRTGGGGARIDLDAMAEAVCRVMIAEGKYTQADVDGGKKAAVRQKLDDDPKYGPMCRTNTKVAAEYAAIKGRAAATVDDLAV